MNMPRMMNLSIIDSDPILFDFRLAYGYHCCCSILTMSHPANEIYGGFWSILLHMFHFEYIVIAFSYLITTEWILYIISTACWLKRHEIYVYCYSCNIYVVFNDIDYSYVMAYHILYMILFDYGCVDYDYIVSHKTGFTA